MAPGRATPVDEIRYHDAPGGRLHERPSTSNLEEARAPLNPKAYRCDSRRMTRRGPALARLVVTLVALATLTGGARADLFGGLFAEKLEPTSVVWELQEQYIRLVAHDEGPPNDHPVSLSPGEVVAALASVQIWEEGGIFRNEERSRVFDTSMAKLLGTYVAKALASAAPNEDVNFLLRGYQDVALDIAKTRYWHSGRVFYRDGRLNVILGEYRKQLDKGKRNVEGSFGILEEDLRDVYFNPGFRDKHNKLDGRVIVANGVELARVDGEQRTDWFVIDVPTAARAYAESQVDPEERREEERLKAEAAKRTLETREMKTELARLRSELKELQDNRGGGASLETIEQRLETLMALKEKGLITDEEYAARRSEILQGI